jgi:hypothetical protein
MGLVSRSGTVCVSALVAWLAMAAAPAAAGPPAPLPDAVVSPNVEYLGSIRQDVGLTTAPGVGR